MTGRATQRQPLGLDALGTPSVVDGGKTIEGASGESCHTHGGWPGVASRAR